MLPSLDHDIKLKNCLSVVAESTGLRFHACKKTGFIPHEL